MILSLYLAEKVEAYPMAMVFLFLKNDISYCAPEGIQSDLWSFNITSRHWTWLSGCSIVDDVGSYGGLPSTVYPTSRSFAASWFSIISGTPMCWIYGGYHYETQSYDGLLGDMW